MLKGDVLCLVGCLGTSLPLPTRHQRYILSMTPHGNEKVSVIYHVSKGQNYLWLRSTGSGKRWLFKTKKIWKAQWKGLIGYLQNAHFKMIKVQVVIGQNGILINIMSRQVTCLVEISDAWKQILFLINYKIICNFMAY